MNKEKKIIIFIFSALALLLLLLAGIMINSYFNGKALGLIPKNGANNNNQTGENKPTDLSGSGQIVDYNIRDEVKKSIAQEFDKYNVAATDKVETISEMANDCLNNFKLDADKNICLIGLAETSKDKSICSKASEIGRQACEDAAVSAKAIADKNIMLCADVKDRGARTACVLKTVDAAGLSSKDCGKLPEDEVKTCTIRTLIVEAKNIEGCGKIADQNIKQLCQKNYINAEKK
jgi:hypothetical protein